MLTKRVIVMLACSVAYSSGFVDRGRTEARAGEKMGGFSPSEARSRMVLPAGFGADVFACEPDIRQPIAACFDERGRMWVVEYLQYPDPAGLKAVTRDVYLRTVYDKTPLPPPKGVRGADRIKILTDTNNDGKADSVATFVDGLNLASGVAVGYGGVFVAQAPYLLFYADKDRDDHPDGDPEVLLSGFGIEDTHAVVNSLVWGPDGWLYGAQGSTVTAKIKGVEFQQGIWRYHPRTRKFELFAEGGGNTWGLDFDATGNAFGSSNGAYITFQMVQGGYYIKGFAKHGPLHNPYTFGYLNYIDYEGTKSGGHVTPGGIIYKGGAFPVEYAGSFIGGNLLSNAVYWHPLTPKGSTYSGKHGGTLVDARDQWFRPIDLLTGPDGAVYVVDWYDRRASHLDPRDTWDKSNGRIYRIRYGDRKPIASFDLASWSSENLVGLRENPNDWWPSEARRILAERRDPAIIPKLRSLLEHDRDPLIACRDLWALAASGGIDDRVSIMLLDHPVAPVRRWIIRLLGDDARMNQKIQNKLVDLAGHEPDAQTRSQLASSSRRWNADDALPIVDQLMSRSEDQNDAQIPLLLWWALEQHAKSHIDQVVALFLSPESRKRPMVQSYFLERLARLLIARGNESDYIACARLLEATNSTTERKLEIDGMEQGLEGRTLDQTPKPLVPAIERLWYENKGDTRLIRLAARLAVPKAMSTALAKAADPATAEPDRLSFVALAGQVVTKEGMKTLLSLCRDRNSPKVQAAAVAALAAYRDPEVAHTFVKEYSHLDESVRSRVIELLCGRKEWALVLVDAIARKLIPAKDLKSVQVLRIAQFNDPSLLKRTEEVWGKIPIPGSAAKTKRIAEVRGFLVEGDKGNAQRGKAVFEKTCSGCHRLFGTGKEIGPDLTGAERGNLDFLLQSLVDPSSVIRKEYLSRTLALKDGRILSGLVVEETGRTLTLFDSKQERTVVARDAIDQEKSSEISVMPEGQLDTLPENEVRDLFRYLQSNGGR